MDMASYVNMCACTQNCALVSLISFLSSMHNYTKKWHTSKNTSAMPLFHTETFIYIES